MGTRESRHLIISALVLAVFAGQGLPVEGQCAPMVYSSSSGPPIFIVKTVPAATRCHLTMFYNADCHPGGNFPPAPSMTVTGAGNLALSATQVITTMGPLPNPSCGWKCYCPGSPSTVQVITNAAIDGLPVELMDFAVEVEEAAGGAGGDDKAGDEADK